MYRVEANQALHGTLLDFLDGILHNVLRYWVKVFAEMPSYTTDEANGEILAVIGIDVEIEEIFKGTLNEKANGAPISSHFGRVVHMFTNERTKGCQKAVGSRLTINFIDNISVGEVKLLKKFLAKLVGELALKKVL